jgi:transposase
MKPNRNELSEKPVGDGPAHEIKRWSAERKVAIVLRHLRGESLDALSRELKVAAARISEWRDDFLRAGAAGLKKRGGEEGAASEDEIKELKAKLGDVVMENELLNRKIDQLEQARPWHRRRS